MTKILHKSLINNLSDSYEDDNIYLFMQFFIPDNVERYNELKQTMYFNVKNRFFKNIYLLNEKYYTKKELGVDKCSKSEYGKIIQKNVEKRLSFKMLFDFIKKENISGYIVIANTDIFFNDSIIHVLRTGLSNKKAMYAQVRYEFTHRNLSKCKLFGDGRADSQDTWIIHSNQIPENTKIFDFNFGVPGCDNKLVYLFLILGYKVYNDPLLIKTYHNHKSQLRNYKGFVEGPHCYIVPNMPSKLHIEKLCKHTHLLKDHRNIETHVDYFNKMVYDDNKKLIKYLKTKIENNETFVIPRIAGVENNVVFVTHKLNNDSQNLLYETLFGKEELNNAQIKKLEHMIHFSGIKNYLRVMKNNAGILLAGAYPLVKYTYEYLKAFENSELFLGWGRWGNVYKYIVESHNFIENKFKNRQMISALSLDIFNYIHEPWTHVLKGKRILIVSPFVESIKEKISIREKIYGVDLFPDCSFVFLKPPQTQGQIRCKDYYLELEPFYKKLDTMKDDFDVALCSCGGYGNIVVNHIYELGKSAIYVGGVLQMYFGIYGMRWMRERKDIMKLYLNNYWSRPKEEERPEGYKNVEKSAYW